MGPNEKMKMLLDELKDTHDLPAFLVKCAEWTLEEIEQYNFKPIPMKPLEVSKYEEIPIEDRENLSASYWITHPIVENYFHLLRKVKRENRSIYEWLKESRGILLVAGRDTARIDEKLKEVIVEQLWSI